MNPDDQLLRDLEGLRATTSFLPTPDFSSRVADSLPTRAGQTSFRHGYSFGRMPRPLAVVAVAALLLVIAVVATLAIPPARESVARWVHIDLPGIRIERVHDEGDIERVLPSSLGGSLVLGTPVSLEGANDLLASPLLAPSSALVGEPMAIWQRNGGETISLLYPPSAQLPEIGDTGVGMLLMRVQPQSADTMFYVKKSFGVEPVVSVSIEGREGWWIVDGLLTVQPEGMVPPVTRASGHVLIWWDSNGVAWRMESALSKDDAIRIASSLAPIDDETGNRGGLTAVWVDEGAAVAPVIALFAFLAQEVSHAPLRDGGSRRCIVLRRNRSRRCRWLGIRGIGCSRRRGRGRETG